MFVRGFRNFRNFRSFRRSPKLLAILLNFALFCSERSELTSAILTQIADNHNLSAPYLHPLCITAQHLVLKSILLKRLAVPILPFLNDLITNDSVVGVLQCGLAEAGCYLLLELARLNPDLRSIRPQSGQSKIFHQASKGHRWIATLKSTVFGLPNSAHLLHAA